MSKQFRKKGVFIVIYGANNIGKSTQVKKLANKLVELGEQFLLVKYPIYQLEPTGSQINKAIRGSSDIGEFDLQKLFAKNRMDFQDVVTKLLNAGVNVLAEDYTGTGLAWGMVRDIPIEKLEEVNAGLLDPDISVLLDGKRFSEAKEKGHRNEDIVDSVWNKGRKAHLFLADRYTWNVVNANDSIDKVCSNIWGQVSRFF